MAEGKRKIGLVIEPKKEGMISVEMILKRETGKDQTYVEAFADFESFEEGLKPLIRKGFEELKKG